MQNAEGRMQNAEPPDTSTLRSAVTEDGLPVHPPQYCYGGRALRSTLFRLVREKIPFFVLSGISCVLTYLTEWGRPEVAGFEASPALLRLENAFVACARYLGKTFWPVNLVVPYTNPDHWSWLEVGGAVLAVVGVCLAALWLGRRRPYLLVGWCWFWGTLIPVIGLTKGWGSFMADRFTYLPSIGLLMLTVWGVRGLARGWRYRALALSVAGGAAIVCCVVLTRHQLKHWRNSITLFEHVVAVTPGNPTAQCNLGAALDIQGDAEAAAVHYRVAIALNPRDQEAHFNLGRHLKAQGHWSEAAREFLAVTRLRPDAYLPRLALLECLSHTGQTREAAEQMEAALRLLAAMPAAPWNQQVMQTTAAMLNNLAWSMATASRPEDRDAAHAVQFAERACELTQNQSAALLETLAAAYAEAGRFKEAVRAGEQACTLATLSGDQALLRKTQERLEKYRAGQPYHEPAAATPEGPRRCTG
jgi:Flp pilus assembly protein TadD